MENENLDSWGNYNDSEYLEAKRVRDNQHQFVCVNVEEVAEQDNAPRLILHLESDEGKLKRKFSLNKTNGRFLETAGIKSPKEVIGRILCFEKVKVNNPSTKQMVDALRICSVTEVK